MDSVNVPYRVVPLGYEHPQAQGMEGILGLNLVASCEGSTNFLEERAESPETSEGRSEPSMPPVPPETEPRKRKTKWDEAQEASQNVLVSKKRCPSAPWLDLNNGVAQMNPKGDEEGRLGLLLNNALLQKQLSQLREEVRANRC